MKHLKRFVLVLLALMTLSLVSCADGKSPTKGYITQEELNSIIEGFDSSFTPKEIEVKGFINYFNLPADKLIPEVDQVMKYSEYPLKEEDKKNEYTKDCSSYFLRLPMHITSASWLEEDTDWSTKYQLESKVYRPSGMDQLYYYKRAEGGFILKLFAGNKELRISNLELWEAGNADDLVDLLCSAKWNITIEYDENGYLVKEEFSTVNAPKNKENVSKGTKEKCCYGQATYEYF